MAGSRDTVSIAEKKRALVAQLLQQDGFEPAGSSTIPIRRDANDVPLSFAQQRLWFLDQLAPGTAAYNTASVVPLDFPVDAFVLERSLNEIVRRHESLRTTFREVNGAPVQVIADTLTLTLARHNLIVLPRETREAEARRRANEETGRPFDLSTGPLLRVALITLDAATHVLVLSAHHIVFDGWSLRVFFQELAALYAAYAAGRASPLPDLPVQYADYAVWQRQWMQGDVLQRHLHYWERQLEQLPFLELPTDHPRPDVASFRGAYVSFGLPSPLVERLKGRARLEGVTLFMLLLGAFAALLHRYTRQNEIVVGSPIAGRNRSQLEGLIGFFVNTLVLRVPTDGELTFRDLLQRVKDVTLGAYAHQDVPFEMLVERLQPERDLGRNPMFQVSFQLFSEAALGSGGSAAHSAATATHPLSDIQRSTSVFDLSMNLWEHGGGVAGQVEYSTDLFEVSTIERMRQHFEVILDAAADNPALRLWELPLLTAAERHRLLVEWNSTTRPYPRDACVHTLFEAQVDRTPEAIAVSRAEGTLTYGALNRRANQIARRLIGLGVGPDVLVGVCVHRSPDMVAALLGILKAGGAYVPLDPSHPDARLRFILKDCGAPVIVTEERFLARLQVPNVQLFCLDRESPSMASLDHDNPSTKTLATDLAYAIYTSGSTGSPKGILVPHRGLVNYLHWCIRAYEVESGGGAPLHSSLAFDLTITALFSPLLSGRTVHLIDEEDGVGALAATLQQRGGFSVVKITPAHLALLGSLLSPADAPGRTRAFVIGGEDLRYEHIAFWRVHAPDSILINEYGPSETVVGCCTHTVARGASSFGRIPIGRPIDNTELFVLDDHLELVPIGVPGELYIGGDGLARGYLGPTDLTDSAFIPHPFSNEVGARIYKTGDLARYLADGELEFLGRLDNQIKLRGFRIEPGEIERRLTAHSAISDAVVILREDAAGDRRLVAYVVARQPAPSSSELHRLLAETLPEYMVPSAFVLLDRLPLTGNGKVDRRALPAPGRTRPDSDASHVEPRTAEESRLAAIWIEVLGIERIGVHDDFFADLGGHSLLAIKLLSRIRSVLGKELPLRLLFERPTIAGLMPHVDSDRTVEERSPESRPPVHRRPDDPTPDVSHLSDDEVQRLLAELLSADQSRQ